MKVSYQSLRAAVALVQPGASWWEGTIKRSDGEWVVVQLIQPREADPFKVVDCLRDHNVLYMAYLDAPYPVCLINVINLVMDLPPKVIPAYTGNHAAFKTSVVRAMHKLGAASLVMEFSGGGDSGNPDDFAMYQHSGQFWVSDGQRATGVIGNIDVPDDFKHMISTYVWDTLVQWDIVNNDGGQGSLTVTLTGNKSVFEFECYTNETIQHTQAEDEL